MTGTDTTEIEGDIVTPEWLEKHGVTIDRKTGEVTERGPGRVSVDGRRWVRYAETAVGHTLDWYLYRRTIDDRQHAAGMKYRFLWFVATIKTRHVQCRYGEVSSGQVDEKFLIEKTREYRKAKEVIRTREAKQAVLRVCCLDEFASAWQRRKTQQAAVQALRRGLDDLVRHFGM